MNIIIVLDKLYEVMSDEDKKRWDSLVELAGKIGTRMDAAWLRTQPAIEQLIAIGHLLNRNNKLTGDIGSEMFVEQCIKLGNECKRIKFEILHGKHPSPLALDLKWEEYVLYVSSVSPEFYWDLAQAVQPGCLDDVANDLLYECGYRVGNQRCVAGRFNPSISLAIAKAAGN